MPATRSFDAIIIGAGAAGMHCAAPGAGSAGVAVLLIDHAAEPGRKILISGGGRCNFTNVGAARRTFPVGKPAFRQVGAWPLYAGRLHRPGRTSRHRLARKDPRPIILRRIGPADRRPCCSPNALAGGVESAFGRSVDASSFATGFRRHRRHATARARRWSFATGGPSIPKLGATGFAYDVARRFGLKIVEPRPALVPLTLAGDEAPVPHAVGRRDRNRRPRRQGRVPRSRLVHPSRPVRPCDPAGVLLLATWRADRGRFPARCSTRAGSARQSETTPRATLHAACSARSCPIAWPKRSPTGSRSTGSSPTSPTARSTTPSNALRDMALQPQRHRRFRQGRSHRWRNQHCGTVVADAWKPSASPGLYAIGEAVDVTGWLGGYNFQWAWASANAAAQAL